VEAKKLTPTGYLLDYLNLLAQQISPPTTYICWANKPGYLFFSFLPSPLARTRTRRRRLCLDSHPTPTPSPTGRTPPPQWRGHGGPSRWLRPCPAPFPVLATLLLITDALDGAHLWPRISADLGRQAAPTSTVVTSTPLHPLSDGVRPLANPAPSASRVKLSMAELFYGNKEEDDMWVLNVIDC